MICGLDWGTGIESSLQIGDYPSLSDDGATMWMTRGERRLLRCGAQDGRVLERNVDAPGTIDRVPIAHTPADLIIYCARPTRGVLREAPAQGLWTVDRRWSLKAADVRTGAFCSIFPVFGPGEVEWSPTRFAERPVPAALRP